MPKVKRKAIIERGRDVLNLLLNPGILMYIFALAGISFYFLILQYWLKDKFYIQPDWRVIADAVLLLTPYFLFKPKWRCLLWIPVVGAGMFCYVNLLYGRAFYDLLPPDSLFMVNQMEADVTATTFALIKLKDLWLLLPIISFGVVSYFARKKGYGDEFAKSGKWIYVILSILIYVGAWMSRAYTVYKKEGKKDYVAALSGLYRYSTGSEMMQSYSLYWGGYTVYFINQISKLLGTGIKEEDKARIDNYISTSPKIEIPDSIAEILKRNKGKNLIFIVVESLASSMIDEEIEGDSVAPFMRKMKDGNGTIVYDKMVAQVSHGRSSDGQFIYNTGILPLRTTALVERYCRQPYPSLAKALKGYGKIEVTGERSTFYNHQYTTRSYGYDRLHSSEKRWLEDTTIMARAAADIKDLQKADKPFYCFITTLEMHDPYTHNPKRTRFPAEVKGWDKRELIYAEKLARFDEALEGLVNTLKKEGLYDNTIVVIASDHEVRQTVVPDEGKIGPECFFMVIGSGLTIKSHNPIGQIDVYPTILDIMGVDDYEWRGLGRSLLRNPNASGAIDAFGKVYGNPGKDEKRRMTDAWDVSDIMIRGGYFGL